MFFSSYLSEETSSAESTARVCGLRARRLTYSILALVSLAGAPLRGFAAADVKPDKAHLAENYGKVPLSFEPNQGQTDKRVQFLSRGPGYGIFLTPGEAVLSFDRSKESGRAGGQSVLQMKLVGANASAAAEAEDKLPGTANYMRGSDPAKWATKVPTYQKVKYAGVYPGVDLVFYGNQRQLEYDFVVAPGRDAGKIALEFKGATPVVDADGDLRLGDQGAKFHKPVVYQMLGGERVAVAGAYEVAGQKVKFRIGKYDHSRELVIDPVVTYLTYLGGSLHDNVSGMAVDASGDVYVAGTTSSTDFPTAGTYSSVTSGNTAIFASKLNQSGTSLIYSTYLASNGNTTGYGAAVDSNGSAYVVGFTDSDGFPVTAGAYQQLCGGRHDAQGNRVNGCVGNGSNEEDTGGVLAKLSADGTSLVYATYFGGNGANNINAVAVNAAGEAYVTGESNAYCGPGPYSPSGHESFECFPTTNGSPQNTASTDATQRNTYSFFAKFTTDGSHVIYSGILGPDPLGPSGQLTEGFAVAVDANGLGYITGAGGNTLYTTDGSYQSVGAVNGNAAFVAKFDPTQQQLVYSTYLGGQNAPHDAGFGIAADANGNAYVDGFTYDCDFPTTTGAFETEARYAPTDTANVGKCHTGFVAKLNPSGSGLVWATYLGDAPLASDNTAQMYALALGSDNSVYVAGAVFGGGYPVVNPVLPQQNVTSAPVVTHLSADGSTALFSSTLGGPSQTSDYAIAVAVDPAGAIYVGGFTGDPDLPTTNNVAQPAFGGGGDGFVVKIGPSTPPQPSNGLTQNLLANPGAELGSLADWTAAGNGTPTVDTGTFDAGINPHTGGYDFVGGTNSGTDSLSQTVSIVAQGTGITAAQVDGGTLFARVSFWEQGLNQGTPSDDGSVTLTFLDGNNASISTVTTSTVDSHDGTWANGTGIYAIPTGTRSITYTMNFIKNQLEDNDAFIDDNSLSIATDTGLTIFPSRLHFGNVAVGSQSAPQTATVTNQQATTTINIQQILSELGSNPTDFIQTNNCPAALTAGASCTLTITFVPDGVGAKSAGIGINTDSVPALQQVAVDGTGTGGILQVNPGNLKTVAGSGTFGYAGDGGPALMAQLKQPNGVAFDPSGNLYIVDTAANVVRKVATNGTITTFAGNGTNGFNGDGGPAVQAELSIPFSVAADKNGNIFIQDTGNDVIRRVDATTGVITTFAGTPGVVGHSGDGGPATAARFNENQGARFDSAGNLYVPTCNGASIRKIDTAGNISTVAGNFTEGFSGDGGQATAAALQCPSGVAIDAAGNLYIADEFNQVIRKVNASGIISTIAGTPGVTGSGGDGGPATAATFTDPNDVVVDSLGNLYVADSGNNRVRKIDTNGVITTTAGGLNNAGSAAVNTPLAVTLDTAGNVYFSDSGNSKIEEIFPQGTQPFPATQVGATSPAQSLTLSNIGNTDVTLAPDGVFNLSGNSGDFALTPMTCSGGAVLTANGGSCTLSITFAPTAVGQRTLTVQISDNALNSPQSFSIGGFGTAIPGQQATPTINWATPAAITTATPLSAAQLDAVATDPGGTAIPGTYVYSPAAGSYLAAGTQTLSVMFTPTDTTDFTTATGTTTIVVTQATTGSVPLTTTGLSTVQNTVAVGTPVQLVATVETADYGVLVGQVIFCNTVEPQCDAAHNLATASLNSNASATAYVPSGRIGVNTFIAKFLGVTAGARPGAPSTSPPGTVTVTGNYATSTALASTGVQGSYALTATVAGFGFGPTGQVVFMDSSTNATLGTTQVTALSQNFIAGAPITVGSAPTQMISTDVNGDGKPDLVVANGAGTMVTVLIGNGDGTYTATPSFGTNYSGISGIAVADFNNDGYPDIATANRSTVGIFLGNGDGTFGAEQDFANTSTSQGVFASDFNGDGNVDLAVTDNSDGITILIGKGDGTFTQPNAPFAAGAGPNFHIGVADFNADGKLDMVVGNIYDNTVSVLLGNGDGTFQAKTTFAAGSGPRATFTGDFNGDGKPDIFVTNGSAASVSVLLGNGDGTFQTQQSFAVGANPYGASVGDLNGDGKLDIAVANQNDGTVSVLFGNGDGTFQPQQVLTSGAGTDFVAIGDANGDGSPDIEAVNASASTATVFLNQTQAAVSLTGVTLPGTGMDTVVATYSGDNVFTGSTSNTLTLPSNPAITPTTPTITWAMPAAITTGTPLSAAQLDAVATDANGAAIPGTYVYTPAAGTYLAPGTQTLSVTFTPTDTADFTTATGTTTIVVTQAPMVTATTLTIASGGAAVTTIAAGSVVTLTAAVVSGTAPVVPGQVAFCDATAVRCTDAHLLATAQLTSAGTATFRFVPGIGVHSYKAVFLGTPAAAGSASAPAALAVTGMYATTTALAASGVQGSYALTATIAGFGLGSPTGSVVFTDTSANGALGTVPVTSVVRSFVAGGPIPAGSSPNQVVPADVDGDGRPDLVLGNQSGTMLTVLLGNGDGTYRALPSFGTNYDGISGLTVADFNGDGKLDIATANGSTVGIFLGNGDGTFGAEQDFSNTAGSKGVFAADFNGDGKLDLAVTDNNTGITIFIGNGDGTFTQLNQALATGNGPTFQVAVADFNHDGNLDIAYGNYFDNTLGVLLGNGDGTFQAQTTFAVGSGPRATFTGDFNGDGNPDVFVTSGNGASISLLLGNGDGTFQAQQIIAVGSNPARASVGDINGDGKLDIAVANQNDGTFSILFGNGDGTFQTQQVLTSGTGVDDVAIADVNGDGSPDLVAENLGSNTVAVFLNQASAAVSLTGVTLPGLGSDNVVASYSGDSVFTGSTSNPLTLASNTNAATVTTLTVTPVAPTVGQSVTFSVAVAAATQLTAVPTGTVTLRNTAVSPATTLGTITLGTAGTGTYSTAALAAGSYSVTAVYSGDGNYAASTSAADMFTVTQPIAAGTATTLAVTSAGAAVTTVAAGSVVTLTAAVVVGTVPVAPGQVAFCDATAAICTATRSLATAQVTSAGTASYKFIPALGTHSYKAVFLGTNGARGSSSAASALAVTGKYATATTITQSGAAGNYTLTGTVVGTGNVVAGPTGTVTFQDTADGSSLGTAVVGTSALKLGFAQVTSATTINYPGPRSAVADFNGDGIPDVAFANNAPYTGDTTDPNTVTIALGNGDGTFTTVAAHPATGTSPDAIVAGDFNGDGKLDLATADYGSSTVTILLGNGDGTFTAAASVAAGTNPDGIVAGDFNGDGIEDLAVSTINNAVIILLGNGDGTFTASTMSVNGYLCSMAVGDFNGDGKTDIAIQNVYPTSELEILLGNGDGTFTVGTPIAEGSGSNLNEVAAGNFTAGQSTDLVVSNQQDNTVTVLLSNGDGTFRQIPVASATGAGPEDVQVADFNRDGLADIAVTTEAGVQVLPGNGDGTFTAAAVATGSSVYGDMAVGDFNGDGIPDLVSSDATTNVVVVLTQITQTAVAMATGIAPLGAGTHQVVASYPGDVSYGASVSAATGLIGITIAPVITWTPAVATIPYGTALGAQQLNATATTPAGVAIAGTFVYTPAAGTVLMAGTQTLSVAFTPTSADYTAATGSATIVVTPTTSVITWAAPAMIPYGTALGAQQLNATAATTAGVAIPGTFVYTPAAGTVLAPGMQMLSVAFAPTDAVDYTTGMASVQIVVGGLTLTSFTPVGVLIGSGDTTITLTGTGFVPTSMVMVNGAAVATAYVSPTMLTAVIPAALLRTMGSLAVTVVDPSIGAATVAQTFSVVPPTGAATLSGPATTAPGTQPTVTLAITNPYPLALTAQFSLAFASAGTTSVDDPSIQFSSGGRTFDYTVAANSTTVPPVQLQAGTDAGTITITAKLMADGVDVTPAGLAPLVIVVPAVVPLISGTTITASGKTLTVVMHGFSNTREVSSAVFDFTAATGDTLATPSVTIPATTIFGAWYGDADSVAYGSTFTYTQVFNTSEDATTIGSVKVTLTNSVGVSLVSTSTGP